jgi:glycosyltransferase involved in cell wall biosynthesis
VTVERNPTQDSVPSVVIVTRSIGFPEGMAGTGRVRCIAAALAEAGAAVTVICSQVSEDPGQVRNERSSGRWRGIHFMYPAGTTLRSPHFLVRRFRAARGLVGTIRTLAAAKRERSFDCVYLYGFAADGAISAALVLLLARWVGIPQIIELTELPWNFGREASLRSRIASPLAGCSGAVALSSFLCSWAAGEFARLGSDGRVFELPILVDLAEFAHRGPAGSGDYFLFSASPGYADLAEFTLDALAETDGGCRLFVTGCDVESPAGRRLAARAASLGIAERLELTGYVDRQRLLDLYGGAVALLAPLADDARSAARFPSKIGEYLATGRPVISTEVGDVPRYLRDGVSAYLAAPGDRRSFAAKMREVLSRPDQAARIGSRGRSVAEEAFDYRRHSAGLLEFVREVSSGAAGQAARDAD